MRSDEHQKELEEQQQLEEIYNAAWKINCCECGEYLGEHIGPHPVVRRCWDCTRLDRDDLDPTPVRY